MYLLLFFVILNNFGVDTFSHFYQSAMEGLYSYFSRVSCMYTYVWIFLFDNYFKMLIPCSLLKKEHNNILKFSNVQDLNIQLLNNMRSANIVLIYVKTFVS